MNANTLWGVGRADIKATEWKIEVEQLVLGDMLLLPALNDLHDSNI